MFESYLATTHEKEKHKPKSKILTFMLNGHPERTFDLQIGHKKGITKQQIYRAIQKNWTSSVSALQSNNPFLPTNLGLNKNNDFSDIENQKRQYEIHNFNLKNLRVFSIDAVQYFDEDLQYLKNGDRLYISNGEQFDNNSNFGQYQIIRKLGEGGFGSVDLAKNIVTNQYAAIKILKPGKSSSSNDIDMIFKEAENLKALNHPNIVKILNCYAMSDMRVVIVMEYLEGGQLLDLLKNQKKHRFQQKQAKTYFKQIISGVGYCHRKGIIHRDLKLQNILIKNNLQQNGKSTRTLKIADFGISGVADKFNPEVDWGTLRYMPPEILMRKTKVNSTTVDVWACGIILYMMVTGKFPFDGNSSSQILQAIVKKSLEFPNDILLTIKCKNLIKDMLEKDPLKRVTVADIEDHPWVNGNITAMTLPEDNWNLKTHGNEQISYLDQNGNYHAEYANEYDLEDLKRISKADLIKLKTKKNFHKNSKQQKNKNNVAPRKSIHVPGEGNGVGLIKIPKRLQKQRDQIIQQLRSYKQFREKNMASRDKQKGVGRMRYNYSSEISEKQEVKDKKLFPNINNRKNSKVISSLNNKKQREKYAQSHLAQKQ